MTKPATDLKQINAELFQADKDIAELTPSQQTAPWWSVTNAMTISSCVLIFGLLVMVLAAWLLKHGTEAEALLRLFGVILIVVGAIFLVVAGYTDTQIAPVIGLLGTIAGYLLGKSSKPSA